MPSHSVRTREPTEWQDGQKEHGSSVGITLAGEFRRTITLMIVRVNSRRFLRGRGLLVAGILFEEKRARVGRDADRS